MKNIESEQIREVRDYVLEDKSMKIPKKAQRLIERVLEEIVPTQDISPKKTEIIKKEIYRTIILIAENYIGQYDSVPTMFLVGEIREWLQYDESLFRESREELMNITDSLESICR